MTSPAGVLLAFCQTTDSSDAAPPYLPLPVQLRELVPANAMRSAKGAAMIAKMPSAQPRRTGAASNGSHHNHAINTIAVSAATGWAYGATPRRMIPATKIRRSRS